MRTKCLQVACVIPALNEEESIGSVVRTLSEARTSELELAEIIVVDNGSTDHTRQKALESGARVVKESYQGYGAACMKGVNSTDADIVLFIDADASDSPEEWPQIVSPIVHNQADLVVGSRTLGQRSPKSIYLHQLMGNCLAVFLLRVFFKLPATDLGPFRAIRRETLKRFDMQEKTFGWTVEMQLKAALHGIDYLEIPVSYRRRPSGTSKISGTLRGTILAGTTIISVISKSLLASLKHRSLLTT